MILDVSKYTWSIVILIVIAMMTSCEAEKECAGDKPLVHQLVIYHQDYLTNPPDFVNYNYVPDAKVANWTKIVLGDKKLSLDSITAVNKKYTGVCSKTSSLLRRLGKKVKKPYKYGVDISQPIHFSANQKGVFIKVYDVVLPSQKYDISSYVPIFILFEKVQNKWRATEYAFDDYALETEEVFQPYMIESNTRIIDTSLSNFFR